MTDVNPEVPVSEEPKPEEVVTPSEPVKPGEKTDPAELLKSLREERERRRIAEEALAKSAEKTDVVVSEPISDEGRFLKNQIDELKSKLDRKEEEEHLGKLHSAFPALRDKSAEFEAFRLNPENAGMKLETAAKAFLVENDLLASPTPRKGLERDTGGARTVPKTDLSADEVGELRKNNYRQYVKLLSEGKIKL